jgi:hypothetical protein
MEIGYMSMDLYRRIIDEASKHLPVKLVIFFRGESLLHPNFLECIAYAKEKGIGPIQYATNAYQLSHEMTDKLIVTGVDFISFSLDTLEADIYKKSRLHGDLNVSIDNVIYISEKCKELKRKGLTPPTLQVSTIEVDEYMPGQKKFIEFWKKYVDIVRVYYEHDDNGKFRNHHVQEMLEAEIPKRQPCRKVFTDLLVYWDGELALCNYDWRGGLNGLNLNNMTIQEAWDSEIYEKVREMHGSCLFADEIMCRNCQHWRIDYIKNGYLGKLYQGE